MGRNRIAPPLGLPVRPNLVTCEKRKAKLLADFRRRLDYVLGSFRLSQQTADFNASLARLERTVKSGRQSPGRGDRVHPLIEILVNHHARKFATERTSDEEPDLIQTDVEKAAAWVAKNVSSVRGRPRAQLLDHHVGGLMALIQCFTGTAVVARRHSGSGHYDPELLGPARILRLLREVDDSITETQLVNKVFQLRRAYADRPMRFLDFYPLYGATLSEDGNPVLASPLRLERFERSVPIYCP